MRRSVVALLLSVFPLSVRAAVDVFTNEGNSGITTVQIQIVSKTPANGNITGQWQTVDGSATVADNDYLPATGDFVISSGQTQSQPIILQIVGDTKVEADETFTLNLFNVNNGAQLDPGPYTIHIINDDVPVVTVSSPSVIEGNSGMTLMQFVVTLTTAAAVPVQATFATSDVTAKAGEDYQAASGTITFAPGVTTQTITVNVIGDTLFEPDETFTLTVTPVGGVSVTATGTILNDDAAPIAALRIVSGNGQSARLGQTLPQPLVVEVTNSLGAVVSGFGGSRGRRAA